MPLEPWYDIKMQQRIAVVAVLLLCVKGFHRPQLSCSSRRWSPVALHSSGSTTTTTTTKSLSISFTSASHLDQTEETTALIHSQIKLPVWPAYSGIMAQVLDWIGLTSLSDVLLSTLGGRVVPMPLNDLDISPFLLLVHHTHSFMPFDPIRPITNLIVPEGFPAHPHSGFGTLTFTLEGGLRHRDSEGIKMQYNNGDAQWMKAGRGVIHEEMWDVPNNTFERIEIFQLWLNSPQSEKFTDPSVDVLRDDEIPRLRLDEKGSEVRVLYGSVTNLNENSNLVTGPGDRVADSPLGILHLTLAAHSTQFIQYASDCSFAVYVQKGSMKVGKDGEHTRMGNIVTYESTRKFQPSLTSESSTAVIESGGEGLQCLILVGKKLQERAIMAGPYVASSEANYNQVARAWQVVGNEAFWDYKIPDEEWRDHIKNLNLQGKLGQLTPDI